MVCCCFEQRLLFRGVHLIPGAISHADAGIGLGIAILGLLNLALAVLIISMLRAGYKIKP